MLALTDLLWHGRACCQPKRQRGSVRAGMQQEVTASDAAHKRLKQKTRGNKQRQKHASANGAGPGTLQPDMTKAAPDQDTPMRKFNLAKRMLL